MHNHICEMCGCVFQDKRKVARFCSLSCSVKAQKQSKKESFDNEKTTVVWSSGGGIQSTAIAVLIWQGKLPKPDFSIMIDTGYESAQTIDYINNTCIPKLKEVGVDFRLLSSSDYVDARIMSDDGHCALPAFMKNDDGSVSKLSTHCNGTWKQQVLRKFLRENNVVKCEDWVGISTDEARRQHKSNVQWMTNRYPLIELGLSRKDCVALIQDAGWSVPVRSSCVMCPQRTRFEWLRLNIECPEDFKMALEYERYIQRINPKIFLTPTCQPLIDYIGGE